MITSVIFNFNLVLILLFIPIAGLFFFKGSKRDEQDKNNEDNYLKREGSSILKKDNIKLGLPSVDKVSAIKMAGQLLVDSDYVDLEYIDAMLEREEQLSTYIGNGVAIPHGVGKAKECIKKSGIVVLQFPNGVSFDGQLAYLVIGIAGVGNEHLDILSNIATALEDEKQMEFLKNTEAVEDIYSIFTNTNLDNK